MRYEVSNNSKVMISCVLILFIVPELFLQILIIHY